MSGGNGAPGVVLIQPAVPEQAPACSTSVSDAPLPLSPPPPELKPPPEPIAPAIRTAATQPLLLPNGRRAGCCGGRPVQIGENAAQSATAATLPTSRLAESQASLTHPAPVSSEPSLRLRRCRAARLGADRDREEHEHRQVSPPETRWRAQRGWRRRRVAAPRPGPARRRGRLPRPARRRNPPRWKAGARASVNDALGCVVRRFPAFSLPDADLVVVLHQQQQAIAHALTANLQALLMRFA